MELKETYKKHPSHEHCITLLENLHWRGVPICPYCESPKQTPLPKELRYHCNSCRASYSVLTKTIFHKTKVDLQKWFFAIPLVIQKRISGRELARNINVTNDTACFMVNRIKLALNTNSQIIEYFLK